MASVCTGQPSCVSLALHLLKNRYLIGCFVLKWTRSLSKARTSLRFDEWRLRVSFYFILLFPFFFYFFARIGVVTSSALIMEREFNLLKEWKMVNGSCEYFRLGISRSVLQRVLGIFARILDTPNYSLKQKWNVLEKKLLIINYGEDCVDRYDVVSKNLNLIFKL